MEKKRVITAPEEYTHVKLIYDIPKYQKQIKDLKTQNEVLKQRVSHLEKELEKQTVFKGATYVTPKGEIAHVEPIYKYDMVKPLIEIQYKRELEDLRKQVKVLKLENRKLLDLLQELCPEAFEE